MAAVEPDNHYEVLGVTRRAAPDEVRKAYLEAARKWHPDRFSGRSAADAAEAEAAMRRVNRAWEVLGDPAGRRAYDARLAPRGAGDRPPGVSTTEGVTRIDPRLLDPSFLAARRQAQIDEISSRSSLVLRAVPLLAVLGLLAAIFVFTAYARDSGGATTPTTAAGPSLGSGIAANDCVVVSSGPALIEVPCPDGERVIGARLPDGVCPLGTARDVQLSNGAIVCLATTG